MGLLTKLRVAAWTYRERAKVLSNLLTHFRANVLLNGRVCWCSEQRKLIQAGVTQRGDDRSSVHQPSETSGQLRHALVGGGRGSSWAVLSLYLLVLLPISVFSQAFEVRGRMVYQIDFGREHVPLSTAVYPFKISVSGSNWLIHTSTSIPRGDPYWEVAHDGRDLYTYQFLTTASRGGDFGFNGSARVERNDTPAYDASFAVFVWLTYGSAKTLPKAGQGQLQPMTLINDLTQRLQKLGVKAEWRELRNSPGLPESVRYIDSGIRHWRDAQGVLRAQPRAGIYSTGYVAATYDVVATTNFGGLVFPSEALIQQFDAKPSGDELVRLFTVRVFGDEFTTNLPVSSSFVPALKGETQIDDFRLWSPNLPPRPIRYHDTNQVWLSTDNRLLQEMYTRQVKEKLPVPPGKENKARAYWVVAALGLITGVFVLFIYRTALRRNE